MAEAGPSRLRSSPSTLSALQQRSGVLGAFARFWQRSYASDYLGLILLFAIDVLYELFGHPFHRQFLLSDPAIQHPHADPERVPPVMMFLYGGGIPLAAILVWSTVLQLGRHKIHVTLLGLFTSVILTTVLTEIIKNAVGRPRPDLLARCKPAEGTPTDDFVDISVCTETNAHLLQSGFKSFPSGHSSFSFSGLGYLSLFFAAQLHTFRPPAHLTLPSLLLFIAPLVGALVIAISRTEDYRHDVFDVTTGSLLGLLMAYTSWRRYYPGLTTKNCSEPYANRGELGGEAYGGRTRYDAIQRRPSSASFDDRELEERRSLRNNGNEIDVERGIVGRQR